MNEHKRSDSFNGPPLKISWAADNDQVSVSLKCDVEGM